MKIEITISEYIESLIAELHLSINTKEAYLKVKDYLIFLTHLHLNNLIVLTYQ
mgnify:CR=1 FL=1